MYEEIKAENCENRFLIEAPKLEKRLHHPHTRCSDVSSVKWRPLVAIIIMLNTNNYKIQDEPSNNAYKVTLRWKNKTPPQ